MRRPSSSTCADPRVLSAALLVAIACVPARAVAASCCGANPTVANRLGPGERASVSFSGAGAFAYAWAGVAELSPPGPAWPLDGRGTIAVAVRLDDRLQLSASVPLALAWQARDEATRELGGGLADLSVGARFEPLDGPGFALLAELLLPSGRTPGESRLVSGADVTGRGVPELRAGAWLEHADESWFAFVQASAVAGLPDRDRVVRGELGAELAAGLGWTFVPDAALSLVVRESLAWSFPSLGGTGARRRLSITTAIAWPVTPLVSLVGAVSADLPAPALSSEDLLRAGASAGIRWAFGR